MSDDREAQKLIDFVNNNKFKASKKDQVNKAIQTLQSKFATDRAGENMKRYAGQILNDSLRDFDATLNFNKANDAGLTYVKYYGDVIPTTREICRNMIMEYITKGKVDFSQLMKSNKSGLVEVGQVRNLATL